REARARRAQSRRADACAAVDDQASCRRGGLASARRLRASRLRGRAPRERKEERMSAAGKSDVAAGDERPARAASTVTRQKKAAMKLRSSDDIAREGLRRLPRFLAEYLAGGSYTEHTLRRNVED